MKIACLVLLLAPLAAGQDSDWPTYGNGPGGSRYSPLGKIRVA